MIYLYIIVLGFALYAFFKFFAGHIPTLTKGRGLSLFFTRMLPLLEIAAWSAYALWATKLVFGNIAAYPVIFTVLCSSVIVTLVWYFFRDFVSGIILRAENGFARGSNVKLNYKGMEIEGVVEKAGYRSLEVVNSKGEHIRIPYAGITGIPIVAPSEKSRRSEHQFSLEITSDREPSEISSAVKRRLMEMPWIVPEEDLRIELDHEPETDRYRVSVWYYSVTPETSLKTEEILSRFLRELG
jgi:hypothetical protein